MASIDEKKKTLSGNTQSVSVQSTPTAAQSAPAATNMQGVSENTSAQLGRYSQGYKPSESVSNAQSYLTNILNKKPGQYSSAYQADLESLYNQVMNRPKFTYDLNGDALYNQYKQQYQQLGKQAMMDTAGQAAMLTGGYGNSYGVTAGNQAYQAYLQKINDIVPELQQQAYDRYTQEGNDLATRLNLTQNLENAAYDRYRNEVSDWNTERDYANADYWNQRNQDYQDYMNMLNYWNQMAQQENQDYFNQQNYELNQKSYDMDIRKMAYDQAMSILQAGGMPSSDLLAQAGISTADANTLRGLYGKSSGGGSRRSSGGGSSKASTTTTSTGNGNYWANLVNGILQTADGVMSGDLSKAYTGVNTVSKSAPSSTYDKVKKSTTAFSRLKNNRTTK